MALKAGYQGIKKSLLDKLLQMSGSLIIKSLGTALSLSDAGELRVRNASDSHSGVVQPDGETTFIEEGLLKAAAGLKYKLFKGTGTEGTSTPINLGENPTNIVALLQLGNHANGYTLFCIGFGNNKCKACWILPNNNAIAGNTLDYSVSDGVLTLSGVSDVSQRADYPDMDYIVIYTV